MVIRPLLRYPNPVQSNEAMIMTTEGVMKARTVRRLPGPDRWDQEDWENLKGLPWAWKPIRTKMPGSSPIPISDAPLPLPAAAEKAAAKPRRFYIRKADVQRYGYTPGCRGCEAIVVGDPTFAARNHSEKCRKRIQEAMERDEKRQQDEDVDMEVSEK